MSTPIQNGGFVPSSRSSFSSVPGHSGGAQSLHQAMEQFSAMFSWASQVQSQLGIQQSGFRGMDSLNRCFQAYSGMGASVSMNSVVGYAAMPDYENAGQLEVDKQTATVTTPGGYKVTVADGKVCIQNPDGKWTDLKAEPPSRTVTSDNVTTESRQLPEDPAVRESDGDVWRYQGTGSFNLPDGTKITIQEKGDSKDLHIHQVDIYNGNKHVSVDSQLTGAEWQTVKRDSQQVGVTEWRTKDHTQQRQVTQRVTEHQEANQKFKTTFSDVKKDGYAHDAATGDGQSFKLAGTGVGWSQEGREVLSGAGKGKDDKTLAYQLGGAISDSLLGHRPIQVPWNVHATQMVDITASLFQTQYASSPNHWQNLQDRFSGFQPQPHLPMMTQLNNLGGLRSPFSGPMGGAAMCGHGLSGGFQPTLERMLGSVNEMIRSWTSLGQLQANTMQMRWSRRIGG
ncbi:hypothetical protein [Hyalangium sp.]|uniref:hypothetical protein n=1 Tax=Hyalangium sp. TaxID=2028555 RepID=UPI002D32C0B9|nr:hypothetical protein [Hyalangium sp.]HYH98531.1 hypothetical protein [Hyalangium sp.]